MHLVWNRTKAVTKTNHKVAANPFTVWHLLILKASAARPSTWGCQCSHNRSPRYRLQRQWLSPLASGSPWVLTTGSQLQITGTPCREATTRKPLLSSHCLRQPSRALRRCQEENWDTSVTQYRLLLLNWKLKECPVPQASVPSALLFLMRTLKAGFQQN